MFSAFFIRRPKFAMVVSLFIMLAGAICYNTLPVAEYPEVAPPTIVVMASYPGASASVVADTVAAPIEEQVNGIEGLIYFSSKSDNSGGYNLTLTFSPETDPNMALVNVNNAVKRAENTLPSEVRMIGVRSYKRSADFLGIVAFTSTNPDHTPLYLSNYVSNNVKDSVARIPGVGMAVIFGEMKYSMRVWLDPLKMRALNVSQPEVQAAIQRQNIQAATGSLGSEGASDIMQFKLETRGRLKEASEFENVIIRSGEQGRQIRLSDVARVELGAESYSGRPAFNGNPAVLLAVFKLSTGNAVAVVNNTKAVIGRLENNFPEGIQWEMPYDSTKFVVATMKEIRETLILTFVLVVLITYIFLQDWRATVIPAVAIPVSLIGTFLFMTFAGLSINTLTMFALILVIGSVVDDAICVVECCVRLIHEEKLSPREAAFRTMRELTGALVATTLVVVAIYTPIAFYGGMVGIIYKQFAVTMCVALVLSSLVALTLSPALCALVLKDSHEPRGLFKLFNIGLDFTRNRYMNVAGVLSKFFLFSLLILAALVFGNYHLYNVLPSAFLPAEDKGAILCEAVLPSGASLPRTKEVLEDFALQIRQVEGVRAVLMVPGNSLTAGEGENVGMVIAELKDWSQRKTPETQIANIQAQIMGIGTTVADASVKAFAPPAINGLGATGGVTFALQATGDQTAFELAQATGTVMSKIQETGKVLFAATSFDANMPMLNLEVDRDKAEAMDVTISSIFETLQGQLGSIYVNDFNLFGKTYKVKIQSEIEFRDNQNFIGQLTVPSRTGALVPIDSVASVTWTVGPRQMERFSMFPCANITVQGLPGTSSGDLMETIQKIVDTELTKDYQIAWTDMSYQESQNEGQILTMMILAIIFAYLFLVAQYESWTTPISVMLSVTTATLGGMFALFLLGRSLDIYCQLGLLMLIGLTAKTAILMVEYSKQLRDDGMSLYDAALNGMKTRFRAVMMTALSFVIGVLPMVVATGAGAGSRRSIGVTTFWGMIAATVVGMILIPSLYVITRSMSETTKRLCGIATPGTKKPSGAADSKDAVSENDEK
ncbi:MAG: efflux RND transporter permease subunit [Planctomycetaceae bacterium]|jgi:hydrophobe/amphiphile efflux-1 (HAE1) family protein|nr:efflux RND transporter permease subunit [Planctomycetaceae bacterium]